MKNKTKGFSLIELVVVGGIMIVLMGVLAPSLIGYAENTRADKDTAQMQEVVTAIETAMTNQVIYDDLLLYALEDNFSCYADGNPTTNAVIYRHEDFNIGNTEGVVGGDDLWSYGDEARTLQKVQYQPSGKMCGLTITFAHNFDANTKQIDIGNALINNMSPEHKKTNAIKLRDFTTDGTPYLYNYLRNVVSDTITTNSKEYKNSEYTVFVRMVPAGVDYKKYSTLTIDVYGQWNGSHLPSDARRDPLNENNGTDIIAPDVETPPAPVTPVRPGDNVTPQTPKETATFIAPTAKTGLKYTDYEQELINPGSSSDGTLYYKIGTEGIWSTEIPKGLNAKQYEVYYYVKGDADHYSTQEYSLIVNISKANPQYRVPAAKTGLKANNTEQALLVPGEVFKGGVMKYRLSTGGYVPAVPTGKAPGTYVIMWKIEEDDNYLPWPETTLEVVIDKMDAGVQAPALRDLTYTGALLQLVDPCVITNTAMPDNLPTVEYSLDGQNWSSSIPYGKSAGDYTVYYRVNENAYYTGTDGKDYVTVTIKKADPNVVIQWNDSLTYIANTAQKFVDDVRKDSEATVYFRVYKSRQLPGDFSTTYPSATAAGEYIVDWYIEGTDNYANSGTQEEPNQKTITIEKAQATGKNKIIVTGDNWVYDKKSHAVVVSNKKNWTITFRNSEGKVMGVPPSATDAGDYTFTWTASHPNFKTEQGTVTLNCAKAPVRVTKAPTANVVSGTAQTTIIVNAAGQELTRRHDPERVTLFTMLIQGECTEGGKFVYTGSRNIKKLFKTENGSQSAQQICSWTLVPISDNYYIEGTRAGEVQLRLEFTVTIVQETQG